MKTPKILGTITTYNGTEHRYLRGHQVKILAILRPGATEDDTVIIGDEAELARLGGVKSTDRVEVAPMVDGRPSFATSDPRAIDLECFRALLEVN